MTRHLSERMMERNITKAQIIETLKNPVYIDRIKESNKKPSKNYIGRSVTVTVNPSNGNIVTAHPTNKKDLKDGRR